MYDPTFKQGENIITNAEPTIKVIIMYPKRCVKYNVYT